MGFVFAMGFGAESVSWLDGPSIVEMAVGFKFSFGGFPKWS